MHVHGSISSSSLKDVKNVFNSLYLYLCESSLSDSCSLNKIVIHLIIVLGLKGNCHEMFVKREKPKDMF